MTEPVVLHGVEGLRERVDTHLGYSEWQPVTQDQVNQFAAVTGDDQWIHVDPERAAEGPFGGTIAHGYLTLSLVPSMLRQIVAVEGFNVAVNYGLERVRFPAPLRVGSEVRAGATLDQVRDLDGGAVQMQFTVTFEARGANKPCCVATVVARRYP